MMRVIASFSVFLVFVAYANAQNQCMAAAGGIGVCIPLLQCPSVFNTMTTLPFFQQQTFVRQSRCGLFSFLTSTVCCPIENNNQQQPLNPFQQSQQQQPQFPQQQPQFPQQQPQFPFQQPQFPQTQPQFPQQQPQFPFQQPQFPQQQPQFSQQQPQFPLQQPQFPQTQTQFSQQQPQYPQQQQEQFPQQQSQYPLQPYQPQGPQQQQFPSPVGNQARFTANDLPIPGRCGTQAKDRIVGGEETSILDYPWMTLLHYQKRGVPGGFLCGGALIHQNYVLTAAHCIKGAGILRSGYTLDYVRLGEHDLRTPIDCEDGECANPPIDIPVSDATVHENYIADAKGQPDDIAIIRLAQSAPYTDFVRPICLPVDNSLRNRNYDNNPLVVAGFGKTETGSQSDVKLQLQLNGFNLQQCANIYQGASARLTEKQMCAGGEQGQDSCSGDSGGPLMSTDKSNPMNPYMYLAGVVSFGPSKCGTKGFPGVYTRVDHYIEWILAHMRK